MTLKIMFKDKSVVKILGVTEVSNLSTDFTNDCLYYEKLSDSTGGGTCIGMGKILCFEVVENGR